MKDHDILPIRTKQFLCYYKAIKMTDRYFDATKKNEYPYMRNETGIATILPEKELTKMSKSEGELTFIVPNTPKDVAYDFRRAYIHVSFQPQYNKGNMTAYAAGTAATHIALRNGGWSIFNSYIECMGEKNLIEFTHNTPGIEHLRASMMENNSEDFARLQSRQWVYNPTGDDELDDADGSFGLRAARTTANKPIELKLPLLGKSINRRGVVTMLHGTRDSAYRIILSIATAAEAFQYTAADDAGTPLIDISKYTLNITRCRLIIPRVKSNSSAMLNSSAAIMQGVPQQITVTKMAYFSPIDMDKADGSTVLFKSTGTLGRVKNIYVGARVKKTGIFSPNIINGIVVEVGGETYPSEFTFKNLGMTQGVNVIHEGEDPCNTIEWHELGYGEQECHNATFFTENNWFENVQLFRLPINNLFDEIRPENGKARGISVTVGYKPVTPSVQELVCALEVEGDVEFKTSGDATTVEIDMMYSQRSA